MAAGAMHFFALDAGLRNKVFLVRAQQAAPRQQELIRSGAVRAIPPRDAAVALQAEGFRLLDIRPAWEHSKARVAGALHVPFFVEDTDGTPLTLLKKWVHFGYIGLWTGQFLTTINERFLTEVEVLVPNKDDKILVACGEGLRSMIAVRALHEGGYKNLGWLAGGFNRAGDGDFPQVEGTMKLQYATVGGGVLYLLAAVDLAQGIQGLTIVD